MPFDWKRFFLSADGRVGRTDFWIGWLIVFVVGLVLSHAGILAILSLLLIWPQICLGAKRLHDIGRSAVLLLLPYGVLAACWVAGTIIGGLAGLVAGGMFGPGAGMAAGFGVGGLIVGLGYLACLLFALWIGLTHSEPGENRFGPPEESIFNAPKAS